MYQYHFNLPLIIFYMCSKAQLGEQSAMCPDQRNGHRTCLSSFLATNPRRKLEDFHPHPAGDGFEKATQLEECSVGAYPRCSGSQVPDSGLLIVNASCSWKRPWVKI